MRLVFLPSIFVRSNVSLFHLTVHFDIFNQLSGSRLLITFLLSTETSPVSSLILQDVVFLLFLQAITSFQSSLLCQPPTKGASQMQYNFADLVWLARVHKDRTCSGCFLSINVFG